MITFGHFRRLQVSKYSNSFINCIIRGQKIVFVGKVLQRLTYHDYLTNPLDRPWPKSIKIVSVVLYFIYKIIGKLLSHGPNILKRNLKTHPLHGTMKRLFFSYANSVASDLFIFSYEDALDTCANENISYFSLFHLFFISLNYLT